MSEESKGTKMAAKTRAAMNALRAPGIHELKTDPAVFQDVLEGRKLFEIRKNDRDFHQGDELVLRETENTGEQMKAGLPLVYTGYRIVCRVLYIMHGPIYGLQEGWVIMGIHPQDMIAFTPQDWERSARSKEARE